MKPRDYGMLFLLGAIWGASFLFIRVSVPLFGPTGLAFYRVALGGIILVTFAMVSRQTLVLRQYWWQLLVVGALNAALPYTLIAFAQLQLPASTASILNSAVPLFTALLASFFLGDVLTPRRMLGLALGMVGVGIVVGWSPFALTPIVLLSVGASLLATFFYGLGNVFAKIHFKGVPSLSLAVGQNLSAALLLVPLAATHIPTAMAPQAFIAATLLGIACTGVATLLYFMLMKNIGPTNTSTVTLIVPMFGILWGTVLLGEALTPGKVVGFAVILCSLVLVTGMTMPVRKPKLA